MTAHPSPTFSNSAFGVEFRLRQKVGDGWSTIRKQSRDPLLRHCVTGPSDLKRTFRAEGRRRIDRPSGFLPYFFNPAVQLSTTVIGVGAGSLVWVLTRKRWPSRLGT